MGWLYLLLLLSTAVFAIARGDDEQRLATCTLLATSVATFVLFKLGFRFDLDARLFVTVESIALAISLAIAFWSSRFWPLLYAALQVATVLSLLSPFFGRNLVSYGLGVMQGMWGFFQLLVLIAAVSRTRSRISTAS